MIVNELKPLLGENWREKFKHRDLWDPDGYGVASFDLGGEREKVLVMNFKTEDIMDYFYDDLPDDEWISLDRVINLLGRSGNFEYYINKNYVISWNKQTKSLTDKISSRGDYPLTTLYRKSIPNHRLIALIFVPNIFPDKFNIVNHKDLSKTNFHKENLEWCDAKWNSSPRNKKMDTRVTFYRRDDGVIYSKKQISEMYGVKRPTVDRAAREGGTYRGHYWEFYNPILEEYLSRHPLRSDWYKHPTRSNIRANGCGVLEIDGKLRIGSRTLNGYVINLGLNYRTYSHRLLMECFLNRELSKDEVVDHIVPIDKTDFNNSKENIRACSQKENVNNPNTRSKVIKEIKLYDLFGNLVDTVFGKKELKSKYNINGSNTTGKVLVLNKQYIANDLSRLNYVYYKWEIKDGVKTCIAASSALCQIYRVSTPGTVNNIRNRYLNTGMPAPDGFYYQQGDPWNMLYDPLNKGLVKKRPEIKWETTQKRNKRYKEGN